jgi:hypothetical protein
MRGSQRFGVFAHARQGRRPPRSQQSIIPFGKRVKALLVGSRAAYGILVS